MPIHPSQRWRLSINNRPRFGKEYNDTYPNLIKHWIRECQLSQSFVELQMVRWQKQPDYDAGKHIGWRTWVHLLHGRTRPRTDTAWKFVRFFQRVAPHQKIVPKDIFPNGVYPCVDAYEQRGLVKRQYKITPGLLPVRPDEVRERLELIAKRARGKRGNRNSQVAPVPK